VHSDYIRALGETGIFGFGAYLWLLFAAVTSSATACLAPRRTGTRTLMVAGLVELAVGIAYLMGER
jgi:O-antigen ligase